MIRRIFAVLHARNLEFVRDYSSLGWNLIVPVMLVFGLGFIFSGNERPLFKVAVIAEASELTPELHPFLDTRYVKFFSVEDRDKAIDKVSRHQIDMLLDLRPGERRYWVNPTSAKGYVLERMLKAGPDRTLGRETAEGTRIRYVDWLLPGILGMNMMFSCLFGVGYVIVRYRKNGYLKRLHATPLSATEFLVAQAGSRLLLIMTASVLVFVGTDAVIHFRMEGSYLDLFLVALLGAVAMVSLGLIVAARVNSEELASGLLNLIGWPMMVLSGVWFSLEGAHPLLQWGAELLPLTHLLAGTRAIMLEGAGLGEIAYHLGVLVLMSVIFLPLGAALFRWTQD